MTRAVNSILLRLPESLLRSFGEGGGNFSRYFLQKVIEFLQKDIEFLQKLNEFLQKVNEFLQKVIEILQKVIEFL